MKDIHISMYIIELDALLVSSIGFLTYRNVERLTFSIAGRVTESTFGS